MEITNIGMAGTMESSDIVITIEPNPLKGLEIQLTSPVEKQFGNQIRYVIMDTLKSLNVENAFVRANDKGALDCIIRARVQTAAARACDHFRFNWEGGNQ